MGSRWFAQGNHSRGVFTSAEQNELLHPGTLKSWSTPGTFFGLCQPLQGAKSAGHRFFLWTVAALQDLGHGTWAGGGCLTPVGLIWLWQVLPKWAQPVLGVRRCFPLEDLPFPPTPEASSAEGAVSSRAWDEKFSRRHVPPSPTPRTGLTSLLPSTHTQKCAFSPLPFLTHLDKVKKPVCFFTFHLFVLKPAQSFNPVWFLPLCWESDKHLTREHPKADRNPIKLFWGCAFVLQTNWARCFVSVQGLWSFLCAPALCHENICEFIPSRASCHRDTSTRKAFWARQSSQHTCASDTLRVRNTENYCCKKD